jgi:hypothetical protein
MLENNIIIYKLCWKKMKIVGTKWVMISRKLRERQCKKKKRDKHAMVDKTLQKN